MIRILVMAVLACLIGLISARMPSFGEDQVGFSWLGFFLGSGTVVLAYLLSRPLVTPGEKSVQQATRLQRTLAMIATLSLFAAMLFFAISIYMPWTWPRIALYMTGILGLSSVFWGLATVWLRKH